MNDLTSAAVTIGVAIVGIAMLAVLVSRNANTAGIINSAGSAFSGALTAAEGPVLGSSFHVGNGMTGPGFYN